MAKRRRTFCARICFAWNMRSRPLPLMCSGLSELGIRAPANHANATEDANACGGKTKRIPVTAQRQALCVATTGLLVTAALLVLTPGLILVGKKTIYEHVSSFDNSGVGGHTSQRPLNGFASVRMYDSFNLEEPAAVGTVFWAGFYCPSDVDRVDSFTISFWADDGDRPGQLLFSERVQGNAGETPVGTKVFVPARNDFCGRGKVVVYEYASSFRRPFRAEGGTKYWLSIAASSQFPPFWVWQFGHGSDSSAVQDFGGERTVATDLDLSFRLVSPASWWQR